MNITLSDFYNALKQAVMFSPQYVVPNSKQGDVWKCRQLQTWRVLTRGWAGDIKSANFGATVLDKGKPFFWSRKWHESKYGAAITWDFPALTLGFTEDAVRVERPFQQKTTRCYRFQLSVVDRLVTDCKNCPAESCGTRTVNEIYTDTEALLFDALYYLSNVKEARVEPGGDTVFANIDYLSHMKESGQISEFHPGRDWGGLLNTNGSPSPVIRLAIEAEGIFGSSIEFSACIQNCEAATYNFNVPDFGVLALEAGCTNCG